MSTLKGMRVVRRFFTRWIHPVTIRSANVRTLVYMLNLFIGIAIFGILGAGFVFICTEVLPWLGFALWFGLILVLVFACIKDIVNDQEWKDDFYG